jgi:hypothetical protein
LLLVKQEKTQYATHLICGYPMAQMVTFLMVKKMRLILRSHFSVLSDFGNSKHSLRALAIIFASSSSLRPNKPFTQDCKKGLYCASICETADKEALGNTIIIGGTGSGKTTFASFLLAQSSLS